MGNFGKREERDFCVNSDCPSNTLGENGFLLGARKILYIEGPNKKVIVSCEVCGYTFGGKEDLSAKKLYNYSEDYVGGQNV